MVLRPAPHGALAEARQAWPAFEATQKASQWLMGCVTQPAHAALSGQIAAALHPALFGPLPAEVIDTIANHDAGWSAPDLAALESAGDSAPQSFLAIPPRDAVVAWRNSIRSAEARSTRSGLLTSRHFTLLDPHDGDPDHDRFRTDETARRQPDESAAELSRDDLDRYTAALGFADLLSLCLCSGLQGTILLPEAHPADPAAANIDTVAVTIYSEGQLTSASPVLRPGTSLSATAWAFTAPHGLVLHRLHWTTA